MKTVYLALPRLGPPEFEAVQAAFQCLRPGEDRVTVKFPGSRSCSILPHGFNQAWVEFLDGWTDDKGVRHGPSDYFAMLHADQHPPPHFVSVLLDEMEAGGFGVIHAPCAIKDYVGVTSTAITRSLEPDGEVRKMAVAEIIDITEEGSRPTFGVGDVRRYFGAPDCHLLPNTGVFLVDRSKVPVDEFMGGPGDRFSGFKFTTWIRWVDMPDGTRFRRAECEPEDWEFGRFCASRGVSVGATTRASGVHLGRGRYVVTEKWGAWQMDEEWKAERLRKSLVEAREKGVGNRRLVGQG